MASVQRAEETQRDEDAARADLAVAGAEVAVIRAQDMDGAAALRQEETLLSRHRLTAPHQAVIVARHAEAGTHDERIFDRFDRLVHLRDGRLTDA